MRKKLLFPLVTAFLLFQCKSNTEEIPIGGIHKDSQKRQTKGELIKRNIHEPGGLSNVVLTSSSGLDKDVTAGNAAIQNSLFNQDLLFVENKGQIKKRSKVDLGLGEIKFGTLAHGACALFGEKGIYFAFNKSQLNSTLSNKPRHFAKGDNEIVSYNIQFENANNGVKISGQKEFITKINYLVGNPQNHYKNISTYAGVLYSDLYDNIDLKYYGTNKMLKYDYVVKPGGKAEDIRLFYVTDSININERGELEIINNWGKILDEKPYAYQNIDGKIKIVDVGYVKIKGKKNRIGFRVLSSYDSAKDLIIDPATVNLQWSTYLGSTSPSEDGYLYDLDVDNSGNVYATGWYSSVYPATAGAYMTSSPGGVDAYVVKLNSTGTSILWATFLGGGGVDRGWGIKVNKSTGEVYVAGVVENTPPAFPTTAGAFQTSHGGGTNDVFLSKLNAAGNGLVFSTFIGGSSNEEARGIDVDASGNTYITGFTNSSNYKTSGAIQGSMAGVNDAFVTKVNSTGTALVYSTYLGGDQDELGWDIAINSSGQAYVTGYTSTAHTNTTPFPRVSAYQSNYGGGPKDAFLTKVNAAGSAFVYSTYLGGGNIDEGHSVVFNSSDEPFVAGTTYGSGFPLVSNLQSFGGGGDAFVTRFNSSGSALLFSTPYGGTNDDLGYSLAITSSNQIVLKGSVMSNDITTTAGAYQTSKPANSGSLYDLAIVIYDYSGGTYSLAYATYFGGGNNDYDDLGAASFAIDNQGCFVIGATSHSLNFPTTAGVWQTTKNTANNETPDQPVVFKLCAPILPVAFSSFTVDLLNGSAFLNWSTSSEKDNSYFVVEKSYDGLSFLDIGKVNSRGNSSGSIQNYSYTDEMISGKYIYYRIRQVDLDGRFSYSKVVIVQIDGNEPVSIYPNPSNGIVSVSQRIVEAGDVEILIIDALGKVVYQSFESSIKGTYKKSLDLSDLAKGMYTIHISSTGENTIQKLILK